ncbi:hypothetical protein IYX23_02465 [Methylocystis sp. L43]|jgi:hypothetical protein|uniref:hypothetical protein n=1 Tax=unclassified Methylocystis TaxID=2625913 RepID=UPI0018C32C94|nr:MULTISPECIES: hypothetical protein [unclassified Methylocystis]MBG0796561.1 hypothetical protein [Methylocystis sp. L43]MBG0804508.1 hypothetical protein [Methylocystis sp. H15]
MSEKAILRFASSAWWAEHPRTHLVVVHAILSLSTDDRTSEEIWLSPTTDEWRKVAELAADCCEDGDLAITGDRMAWRILSRTFRADAPPFSI